MTPGMAATDGVPSIGVIASQRMLGMPVSSYTLVDQMNSRLSDGQEPLARDSVGSGRPSGICARLGV